MEHEITVTPTEVEQIIDGGTVETEARTLYALGNHISDPGANASKSRWRSLLDGHIDELTWPAFDMRVTLEEEDDHVEEWQAFWDSIRDQPAVSHVHPPARDDAALAVELTHADASLAVPDGYTEIERTTDLGITYAWVGESEPVLTDEGEVRQFILDNNEHAERIDSGIMDRDLAIRYDDVPDDDPTLPENWSVDSVGNMLWTWVSQDE